MLQVKNTIKHAEFLWESQKNSVILITDHMKVAGFWQKEFQWSVGQKFYFNKIRSKWKWRIWYIL